MTFPWNPEHVGGSIVIGGAAGNGQAAQTIEIGRCVRIEFGVSLAQGEYAPFGAANDRSHGMEPGRPF